jgi:hypothetical protein
MTDVASTTTAAITALLEIMGSESASMRRRLAAAETLLAYEAPSEVVEWAKTFLLAVLQDRERINTGTRLQAGTLLRKAEAKRVVQQSVRTVESSQQREQWREIAIIRRRRKLRLAGLWPPPKDWCDDLLSPDYEPYPGKIREDS